MALAPVSWTRLIYGHDTSTDAETTSTAAVATSTAATDTVTSVRSVTHTFDSLHDAELCAGDMKCL